MTTDDYIKDNKSNTFKKGDLVVMHSCVEANISKNKDVEFKCKTDSFVDRSKCDVVFLENYSGYFMSKYLKKV